MHSVIFDIIVNYPANLISHVGGKAAPSASIDVVSVDKKLEINVLTSKYLISRILLKSW